MKRHAALRKLSSDHHRALVLARRLCSLAAASLTRGGLQLLLGQWRREIAPHFVFEEEWVLPVLARFTAPDHALIQETLRQHLMMRVVVDEISEACAEERLPDPGLLQELGVALREHVRFEERELFTAIEVAVPEAQLQRLQWRLNP